MVAPLLINGEPNAYGGEAAPQGGGTPRRAVQYRLSPLEGRPHSVARTPARQRGFPFVPSRCQEARQLCVRPLDAAFTGQLARMLFADRVPVKKLVVLPVVAPPFQELEPPSNPARFSRRDR